MLKRKNNKAIEQMLDLFALEESELSRSNSCISILKKCPQLSCSAILEIQPLAPLSMVSGDKQQNMYAV
jgi:hypothetical protein